MSATGGCSPDLSSRFRRFRGLVVLADDGRNVEQSSLPSLLMLPAAGGKGSPPL